MANEQNLKHFTSEYQPANRGRKKGIFNTDGFEKLSSSDMALLFSELLQLNVEELQKIASDKNEPIIRSGMARALIKDGTRGVTYTLQSMFDRMFGKARQQTDITSNGKDISKEPLTIEIIDSRDKVDKQE